MEPNQEDRDKLESLAAYRNCSERICAAWPGFLGRRAARLEPHPLLGGAAAVAVAVALTLGMTGCASRGGTQGTEASNGRLPRFESASIEPDKLQTPLVAGRLLPGMPASGVDLSGGNFSVTTIVSALIMDAYGQYMRWLNPSQVLGGPAWMRTDFYQINAKVSDSNVNGRWKKLPFAQRWNEAMLMLRALLIDRFKLRVRHDRKVLPVFALVLAKNGPKITEDKTGDQPCRITDFGPGKGRWMNVESCQFSNFAGILSIAPGLRSRVLVDRTGLHGRYSFKLHWTPKGPPGMPATARGGQGNQGTAPAAPSGPPLLTALREQLGLRVVSGKAPEDIIDIEHIERPLANSSQ